jgi:hypothetical protein
MEDFQPVTDNGVTFAIDASPTLYYANALNHLAFIRELTVESDDTFHDIDVAVTFIAADGPISKVHKIPVGTLNHVGVTLKKIRVEFDPNLMFQIKDAQPGTIRVEVIEGEQLIASAQWTIEILAANYWRVGADPINYISLAAFVQPNHPSVQKIISEAVSDLKDRGKNPSLHGYQNIEREAPYHSDEVAESIFNAIKARKITYSEPPASWASAPGQKIRSAQEVLDDGVATCLDSAALFASCLEQVGLYPLLALVPGHAFVGYWTSESQIDEVNPALQTPPLSTIDLLANHLDTGKIRLFETTMVCEGHDASFSTAIEGGRRSLESAEAFSTNLYSSYFVNILTCRGAAVAIYPMPAKFVEENGEITIVEYTPTEVSLEALRDALKNKESRSGNTLKLNVPTAVKTWLDSLLDLSLRNPLINMKPRRNSVKVILPPDYLGTLEDLLQDEKSFLLDFQPVIAGGDGKYYLHNTEGERGATTSPYEKLVKESFQKKVLHTDTDPNSYITKLRTIHSEAKTFLEETGSNGLYLALGSLRWKVNGSEIDSPLILVPVTLTARNRNKEFALSLEGSEVTPNFSLVEKLRTDFNLDLTKLATLQGDNLGVDVEGTFTYIREELIKAGLNEFRVDPTVVLGIFNFSSFRLWKDLLDNWQKFERNPLVKHLIHSPNEGFVEPVKTPVEGDLDALIAQLPIPADGSQAAAVAKAAAGHTFILQGPPGTGKSQTITNLLAHALDKGLRVLFVAEKKDALDVVKERMDATGIGAFSLDLHDKGSTSKAVRAQLAEVVGIEAIPDKPGYDSALADYESALGPLNNYRADLHKLGPLGESVYSAKDWYLSISGSDEMPISGESITAMTLEIRDSLLAAANQLPSLGKNSGNAAENPWSLSARTRSLSGEELIELKNLTTALASQFAELMKDAHLRKFVESASDFRDLALLKALKNNTFSSTAIQFVLTANGLEQAQEAKKSLLTVDSKISEFGYAVDRLSKVNLDEIEGLIQEALNANAFTRALKIGKPIKQLNLALNVDTGTNKDSIRGEVEKLQSLAQAAAKCQREISSIAGLRFDEEPNFFSKRDIQNTLEAVEKLISVSELGNYSGADSSLAQSVLVSSTPEARDQAVMFAASTSELCRILEVDDVQLRLWQGQKSFGSKFGESIAAWDKDTREYGQSGFIFWNQLMVAGKAFIDHGHRAAFSSVLTGEVAFENATNAFRKGYYKAIFENLLVKHGLHNFNSGSINSQIHKLETAHEALRDKLPKVLGAELLKRRDFNPNAKIGAFGDFMLAITQSRSSMPLRTLLSRHWDVISKVTPCILASPDSAVRFIDPNYEAFDLVIFDEASQIRVANSIGALGRARAAVVVGDSEQMPPTSVAQSKLSAAKDGDDEEEEDSYLVEAESILDKCVNVRIPEIMLNWHYRSEDESLIAFSNEAYYQSKLSTFPTPNLGDSDKRLEFRLIENGQFLREADGSGKGKDLRTNPEEAKAIVAEIARRLNDPATANDTLGVVTLNKQQQELIRQLLNEDKDKKLTEAMKNGIGADSEGHGGVEIFVKNLETVQGSERDVVLFSVAFSAMKNDRSNFPTKWGPLTYPGGHRRLNVAITRARKSMIVFCSFEPKTLVQKKPISQGLKDFGNYLMMASNNSPASLASLATTETRQDRHRAEVLHALRNAGLIALEEIGLSDFKVDIALADPKKPGKAVLGILLDGRRWNSRATVSDRDSLPVKLLTERMGWNAIERIWLPTWIRDQKGEVERIKAAFEEAKKVRPSQKQAKAVSGKKPLQSTQTIFVQRDLSKEGDGPDPVDELLAQKEEWMQVAPTILGEQEYLNYIGQSVMRNKVNDIVLAVLNIEGPASPDRLGKLIAACFGFSKVPAARVAAINGVIAPKFKRDAEGFVYPAETTPENYSEWRWSRLGEGRVASQISLCEMANAMKSICEVSGGVRYEQLVKETTKVFGFAKKSSQTDARFTMALEWGISNGRLAVTDEYIVAKS